MQVKDFKAWIAAIPEHLEDFEVNHVEIMEYFECLSLLINEDGQSIIIKGD